MYAWDVFDSVMFGFRTSKFVFVDCLMAKPVSTENSVTSDLKRPATFGEAQLWPSELVSCRVMQIKLEGKYREQSGAFAVSPPRPPAQLLFDLNTDSTSPSSGSIGSVDDALRRTFCFRCVWVATYLDLFACIA